ncbi:MAG: hypothetical protein LKE51_09075 [Selenomonas sp.]|nr:hypothetical protein [Selenomonas sp.]
MSYMNGTSNSDEFVQEIAATIQQLKQNEEERLNYMTFEMKLNEEREEGRAEGREEGEVCRAEKIAVKMLSRNTPIPEIHEITELPESRILEIAKEHNFL